MLGAVVGALSISTAFVGEASAQGITGDPLSQQSSIQRRVDTANARDAQKKRERAPDTLPGAQARAPVAPAQKSPNDMSPNDAMFDAINRGDIATVRDAISRGAQLDARNVLGMTPLELSVDLGRNDISFLLLSMRGEYGSDGARHTGALDKAFAADAAAEGKASRKKPARVTPAAAVVATKPVSAPKLFANDGGAPVPSAGFLGFGTRSAAN
ncbi:MAG TPA: ankyrin repeat domain-containing protein [Rhodopila sp.]|nr:ankyrin repeat domain-containing protein [Rhodopila sp.]